MLLLVSKSKRDLENGGMTALWRWRGEEENGPEGSPEADFSLSKESLYSFAFSTFSSLSLFFAFSMLLLSTSIPITILVPCLFCFLSFPPILYDDDNSYLKQLFVCFFFFPVVKYTADEIRKMEESIRIRRSKEPTELVQLVSTGFLWNSNTSMNC